MNTAAIWILTLLAYLQAILTYKTFVIDGKQLNQVRALAGVMGAGYLILAILSTAALLGRF